MTPGLLSHDAPRPFSAPARTTRRACGVGQRLVTVALLGGSLACSAQGPASSVKAPYVAHPLPKVPDDAAPETPSGDAPAALDAELIERLAEGTFGPYLSPAAKGPSLAAWAAVTPAGSRRWFTLQLDARGAPLAAARDVGPAPNEIGLVSVEPITGGYAIIASSTSGSSTRLSSLALGARGERTGSEITLAQTTGEIVWLDALQAGSDSVVLWATLGSGAADIRALGLPAAGSSAGQAVMVLSAAKAWQAVEFGDGLALAAVAGEEPSNLSVAFLDEEGRALGRTEVARGKRFGAEIDAARVGDALVLGWTEEDGLGPRLQLAALGADTRVLVPPAPALRALGEQRLVEIVPALDRRSDALLVWEDLGQAPRGERRIRIAPLSPRANVEGPEAELSLLNIRERPEFARKGQGLAALLLGPMCLRSSSSCDADEGVPTFVELGAGLDVVASEPLRLSPEHAQKPALAWGLRCAADTCFALSALPNELPVPIYGVELRARSRAWNALGETRPKRSPAALDMRALAETDPLADVAATALGDEILVASLTQFDDSTPYVRRTTPAPDGRLAPLRALLRVQALGKNANAAPQVVSYRARAAGGLALVAAPEQRAFLAWTALDRQRPEVFGTLVAPTGKALVQRMLTVGAGEVTRVAAAALPVGFVVAWIGDGEGVPQAFSTWIGADLNRKAAPKALTRAPGAATAMSLVARGEEAWLAVAERVEHEQVLSVMRADARARESAPLVIRRLESGSLLEPTLVTKADGMVLGWLERPSVGEAGGSRAWLVELGPEGKPKSEPIGIASRAGDAASLRMWCNAERCHGALDCRPPNGHQLEGFAWAAGETAPQAERLVWRSTIAADPDAFAVVGDSVIYADRRAQRGLSRRVRVAWR